MSTVVFPGTSKVQRLAFFLKNYKTLQTTDHKQTVVHRGNEFFTVDCGMKSILEKLWEQNVSTRYSCQGEYGEDKTELAYISFPTQTDLYKALDILNITQPIVFGLSKISEEYPGFYIVDNELEYAAAKNEGASLVEDFVLANGLPVHILRLSRHDMLSLF